MFRWKRALLHALIPFGLVIVGGFVLFAVTSPVDAEKAGEGVGRFAGVALVAGLGISYLAQTGRQKAAALLGVGLVVLISVVVGLVAMPPRARPLRAADRAPLVEVEIDGKPRLKHPTLGFSILRPPTGYHDSPQIAAAMGGLTRDPGSVVYAYAEDPPQGGLIVTVMNNHAGSRRDLQEFLDGIQHGIESSVRSQLGESTKVQIDRKDVTGDDAHLEAHLHAVVNGVHMQVNGYPLDVPERPPVIVNVMVVGPEATLMADVLASFRP